MKLLNKDTSHDSYTSWYRANKGKKVELEMNVAQLELIRGIMGDKTGNNEGLPEVFCPLDDILEELSGFITTDQFRMVYKIDSFSVGPK